MLRASITALNVYPVKSCRGIALQRADVVRTGLAAGSVRDREWMVVDAGGRFVTQREQPPLALVETTLVDGRLQLQVPRQPPFTPDNEGPVRDVVVWRAQVRGRDGGDHAAQALSRYLGQAVRLVRFDDSCPRRVNPTYARTTKATTLYADGYPVLVIGQASLDDLNARMAGQGSPELPMNRFRPNIVVNGLAAYEEDHVDTLAIGEIVLKLVKPCTRCEITTTDQATGHRLLEPLRTLAGYRRDDRFGGVTFGMNAIVVKGDGGALRVGDESVATFRFD